MKILQLLIGLLTLTSVIADEEPLATFAVVSNPYITTLPPEEILDENGRVRDFLAKTAPPAMEKMVGIVNELKPDALIVLGSMTWSGSPEDFAKFKAYLNEVEAPTLLVPASRDVLAPNHAEWIGSLGELDATNQVRSIAGVRLAFADDLHTDPDAATARLKEQLAAAGSAAATLLLSAHPSIGRSLRTPDHAEFWQLVEDEKIAAEFEASRYGYAVNLIETLPTSRVGSIGWSTRGAITRIRVFENEVEISQFSDPDNPTFALRVPNPVNAPRLSPAAEDPHGCLTYTAELAKNPDFTAALISDPQLDRERNRQYLIDLAEAGVADLNRLNPDVVIITGDLVNNNLPEEWELFNETFSKLKPRRIDVPGNHDVLFNYNFVEASYNNAPA
ncbi:MAG: metallophosphoesterase, partial [Verrucomicrobiota bacterium]